MTSKVISINERIYFIFWKERGVSILCDAWTGPIKMFIINFLVYSNRGTIFHKSVNAIEQLNDCLYSLRQKKKKVLADADPRWNFTFCMVRRLLELQRALNIVIPNTDCPVATFDSYSWKLMSQVCELLAPFLSEIRIKTMNQRYRPSLKNLEIKATTY